MTAIKRYNEKQEIASKNYLSINSFVILLLAILDAIKPKTVIVAITINRLENLNSTE